MPAIFSKLRKIEPVYDFMYNLTMLICKLLLIADIIIMSWVVLARYVTAIPAPSWGEEIILTLMGYMSVLSAALAIRRNAHVRMQAFDRYLPPMLLKILELFSDCCVMGLAFVMLVVGWKYATGIGAKGTYISLPNVSKIWMYLPIPVAGLAMILNNHGKYNSDCDSPHFLLRSNLSESSNCICSCDFFDFLPHGTGTPA